MTQNSIETATGSSLEEAANISEKHMLARVYRYSWYWGRFKHRSFW
ncbi:MAG UNVERIFIED_CONTAM: hypothetical protein LVQ98_01500 [Rickettsiaceae bacterium]